jgi:predicted porin
MKPIDSKALKLGAIAAALFACTAQAQTANVTLYGLIDATVRSVDNSSATGGRLVGFQTPWFSGSRWGLTGAEGLGGGLKAIFRLESEFVIGNGALDTPGFLFIRDAWVGLESDVFGKLTFGRQNALGRDFAANYLDPYGSAESSTAEGGGTNTNNFKQMIFYAGSATGTRLDNGIVLKKAFGPFVAGIAHQLGEVAGDSSRNTTQTGALAYNGGVFNAAGFVTQANVAGFKHRSASIGGNVNFGIARLVAGYFHYTAEQPVVGQRKDDSWTISTKLTPAGPFDYELGYQEMKTTNGGYNAAGSNTLSAFASTAAVTKAGSGSRKTIYGSAFYHLSKRTELYLAADRLNTTNGYKVAATNGFPRQTEFAVGIRTRF